MLRIFITILLTRFLLGWAQWVACVRGLMGVLEGIFYVRTDTPLWLLGFY